MTIKRLTGSITVRTFGTLDAHLMAFHDDKALYMIHLTDGTWECFDTQDNENFYTVDQPGHWLVGATLNNVFDEVPIRFEDTLKEAMDAVENGSFGIAESVMESLRRLLMGADYVPRTVRIPGRPILLGGRPGTRQD